VVALKALGLQNGADGVTEADVQMLVQEHPECLPIAEIDPIFSGPIPICTELGTSAGPIDNFMITASGLPVLVECKLWRNPEARREVVGQILDYAKELSRWSSSDLQREVKARLKGDGNPLLDLVKNSAPELDEGQFNDAVTANLRRGRFLLLIVGDGIREGVEAIAEYLQAHAGLHFSLGLVEMPIYRLPSGDRLLAPRVLARTSVISRTVVALPDRYALDASGNEDPEAGKNIDPKLIASLDATQRFWAEFLSGLKLDDPEQAIPRPARQGYITFSLPAPGGSSWLTVYRNIPRSELGVYLSSTRDSVGDRARLAILDDWEAVKDQLGGNAKVIDENGRALIRDLRVFGPLDNPEVRKAAFAWLADRVNVFVNILRPRVRSIVADLQREGQSQSS
jgi:hypothetical protein